MIFQPGVTLRDLDLTAANAGSTAALAANPVAGITLERLRISGTGTTSTGAVLNDGTLLRDSFVSVAAAGGAAVSGFRNGASTVVNVTARATGSGGLALLAADDSVTTSQEVTVVNSILQGAGADIDIDGTPGTPVTVRIDHSHWQTQDVGAPGSGRELVAGAGNQTAEPQFELDGVTQAAGSPTINAGRTLAQLGTKDLFGGTRPSGSAPDIGAHEVQETPPVVVGGGGRWSRRRPCMHATAATPAARRRATRSRPPSRALSMSSRRFRAARGTTFRWTLSEAGDRHDRDRAPARRPARPPRRAAPGACGRPREAAAQPAAGSRQRRCTIFRGGRNAPPRGAGGRERAGVHRPRRQAPAARPVAVGRDRTRRRTARSAATDAHERRPLAGAAAAVL